MPSLKHEVLVDLFRHRPALAPEILRDALGVSLPPYTEVRLELATLTQVTPTEYRADLVVLLWKRRPVLSIVVEVQLARDPDKPWTWPSYLAVERERRRCPTCLLIVTPNRALTKWCSRPITVGPGWLPLTPYVLGPKAVPVVTKAEQAKAAPELAVLSVMAHGRGKRAVQVALAALGAAAGLDEERALFYTDLVMSALSDAALKALEDLMREGSYEYQSDFAKKYFGQGLAAGEARGEARGKQKALRKMLEQRFGSLSPEQIRRLETADPDDLLDHLLTAATLDELFGD